MLKDYLRLHFIVFLWGFTSVLGREVSLDANKVVLFRTALSAVALGSIIAVVNSKKFFISFRLTLQLLGVGALVWLHWFTFFHSAKISRVSICLAGLSTVSFFTAIIEPLLKKTRIKGYEIVLSLLIVLGLYVIFRFEFDHFWGLTYALISAFLGALFSGLNALFIRKSTPLVITFYEMIGAMLFAAGASLWDIGEPGVNWIPQPRDWLFLTPLALLCTVFAFYESISLLHKFSVFAMNLTVNLEPVYGIIIALLYYGQSEEMSSGFYLGAAVILITIFLYPILKQRFG